jgi:microcompartment protein CcmK/EutM
MANDFAAADAYRSAVFDKNTETNMQLARVRGNVVASIKAPGLSAHKLLLLETVAAGSPLASAEGVASPSALYVAIDLAGAGVGEVVLVTLGSAARVDHDGQFAPTDAAVVAIVDSVQLDGEATFVKH